MIQMGHYGPDGFGGTTHKGERENCPHPECAWPREGDWATGVCTDGTERTGTVVDLFGAAPVIQTWDGTDWPVRDLRKPDRGSTCPHGRKIEEEVAAEHTCRQSLPRAVSVFDAVAAEIRCPGCHPATRIVEPWPCTAPGCTRERFERAVEAEVEEYWDGINDLMRTQYE